MNSQTRLVKEFLIQFAFAYLGCILIGLIFFQFNIFDSKSWAFDFMHFGALTAVFFALLQTTTIRNAAAAYVVLAIISQAIFPKPYDMPFSLFWNIFEHIIISVVVYLYWRFSFLDKNKGIRPFLLAGYFMIAWALISIVLRVYTNWYDGLITLIYKNLQHGLIFGLGLGLGTEVGNLFFKRNDVLIKDT
jgi:hypothetical protein